MNHGFKLHPDGTLEITMPKGKKVSRVLVCEAGTQNGTLMYPDCDDCIKHGGNWECDHVNCHKGKNVSNDVISRKQAPEAIQDAHHHVEVMSMMDNGRLSGLGQASNIVRDLPSAEPKPKTGKWLRSGMDLYPYECDQCGCTSDEKSCFCPDCGALMEGEKDD